MATSSIKAVILGGSGNVGKQVVSALCASTDPEYSVTLISRRPLPEFDNNSGNNSKVKVRVVENMDKLEAEDLQGFDAGFMLMGIGKASQASKEELLRVDCSVPVAFATACKKGGVHHFSSLSSVDADITQQYSPFTKSGAGGGWYLHVKGAMEEGVTAQNFRSAAFFRPAGIYPGNDNTPSTFGWLNEKLNWLLPAKYVTAGTTVIADAMVVTMKAQLSGTITGCKVVDGGQAINDIAAAAAAANS